MGVNFRFYRKESVKGMHSGKGRGISFGKNRDGHGRVERKLSGSC